MSFYTQPSGQSGTVALKAATVSIIGGANARRRSIVVFNNGGQIVWLAWGDFASAPSPATVKATGIPVAAGAYSPVLVAGLTAQIGGNTPTLFGVTDSGDQTSPADTRWAEQS